MSDNGLIPMLARAFGPEMCSMEGDGSLRNEFGNLQEETLCVDEADYTDADEGIIRLSGYVDGNGDREFNLTLKIISAEVDPPNDTYARD